MYAVAGTWRTDAAQREQARGGGDAPAQQEAGVARTGLRIAEVEADA